MLGNLAVEAVERWRDALNGGDIDTFLSYFHPDVDYETDATFATPAASAADLAGNLASVAAGGGIWDGEPVGVAGDRWAVFRFRSSPPDQDYFNEFVMSVEVDADGRCTSVHTWDVQDLRVAFADCRRRSGDVDAASELALNERDVDAYAARFPPAFRAVDRRRTTVFDTLDRDQWVELFGQTLDQLPHVAQWGDIVQKTEVLRLERFARWADPRTPDPAWTFVVLSKRGAAGPEWVEVYDGEQFDEARARFEELAAELDG